uniref:Uncharacterized protein n=1 Tax=Oryza barthii TaxID=65489 RepID=A0A0D3G6A6_9ORYZ
MRRTSNQASPERTELGPRWGEEEHTPVGPSVTATGLPPPAFAPTAATLPDWQSPSSRRHRRRAPFSQQELLKSAIKARES